MSNQTIFLQMNLLLISMHYIHFNSENIYQTCYILLLSTMCLIQFVKLYLSAVLLLTAVCILAAEDYSNSWAVRVHGGRELAIQVAKRHGFRFVSETPFDDIYHFKSTMHHDRSRRAATYHHNKLKSDPQVHHAEQQLIKTRHKRDLAEPSDSFMSPRPELSYSPPVDPYWEYQWYMQGAENNINVVPAWVMGVSGKGVVVTVLDDGLEHTHPDIQDNYDLNASFDYNSEDTDPSPRLDYANTNKHGTRCAGEIAAVKNNLCITGVAFNASIGGIRMLDGSVTDLVEGSSLGYRPQHIDIYSSSWGPEDDGRTVDGPGSLAKKSFEDGVHRGRSGLGSIFVWASGNGGIHDSCNCDGYALSLYTISVSSVSEANNSPWYSEHCSSTLTSTYSSGQASQHKIITTDIRKQCTKEHTGTSASAPMAAGILALALEVNPHLTWRDVQHLVVLSSKSSGLHGTWTKNGIGYSVSPEFGFGVLDAFTLVNRARKWVTVGEQHSCVEPPDIQLPTSLPAYRTIFITTTTDGCRETQVNHLEHVQVILTLSVNTGTRGKIEMSLKSPAGTKSILLKNRIYDSSTKGFNQWPFMSTHFWGESPLGEWELSITALDRTTATVNSVEFVFHGTKKAPPFLDCIPEQCHPECVSTCADENSSSCDACKNYRVRDTWECVAECPPGYYPDQKNKVCLRCSVNCNVCSSGYSFLCTECNQNYTLTNGSCSPLCPDGSFYSHETDSHCLPCHNSCYTCIGMYDRACTSCEPDRFLMDGVCIDPVTECGDRMYKDRYSSCKPCPLGCLECSSHDNCLKCTQESHNSDHMCSMDCPGGFFYRKSSHKCEDCHSTCLTCSNGSDPTHCSTCTDGYQLSLEKACVPCCDFSLLRLYTCCNCTKDPNLPDKNTCSLIKLREESFLGELRYILLQTKPNTLIGVLLTFAVVLLIGIILLFISSLYIFPKTNHCFTKRTYEYMPTNHFQSMERLQDLNLNKYES